MANYVVINLAEVGSSLASVTNKVKGMLLEAGKKPGPKPKKGQEQTFTQTNSVVKYDLVDATKPFDRSKDGFWFGLGIDALMEMRLACLNADRVYLCAHGGAADRGQVFAEQPDGRTAVIASVGQLGDFVEMILDPSNAKQYELVCVICFAARSSTTDSVHTKDFLANADRLKSSLAYKLFKHLIDGGLKVRMSARIGEAKVQWGFTDLVTQTEDAVLAGLQQADVVALEVATGKNVTDPRKTELRQGGKAANDAERKWLAAQQEAQKLKIASTKTSFDPSKGLVVYEKSGASLVISFEGETVYSGAML